MSEAKEKEMELTTEVVLLGGEFLPLKKKAPDSDKVSANALKKYQKMMETGESLRVTITKEDDKLNLYGILPGDIEGVIPNGELYGKFVELDSKHFRGQMVGKELDVVVTDVDMEQKYVTLSHEKWRADVRGKLVEQIRTALKEKRPVKLRAKIMKVNYAKRVLVDIAGVGLLGIIPQEEWKHGHEYHIEKAAKPGSVIEVVPTKYNPPKGTKKEAFICSRRALMADPWETIEDKFPVNTTLIVECIQKKEANFFGRTAGLELDLFCEYPNEDKNIRVLEGNCYKGVVYRSDRANKALMVRIFQEVKTK